MKTKNRSIRILIWATAIIVNIKSIFCDYGLDDAYALATSWRHINGDRLFGEMREPHMTSSYLLDFIVRMYYDIFKTTDGIAIFCQIVGVLLFVPVCVFIYRWMRRIVSENTATVAAAFFFVVRPKQTVFPEYSNLIVILSVLLWMIMSSYLNDEKKTIYLLTSGVVLSLLVLTYPSALVIYIGVVCYAVIVSQNKLKTFLGLTAVCGVSGSIYLLYLAVINRDTSLIENITFVFKSDEAHSNGLFNMAHIWKLDIIYGVFVLYVVVIAIAVFEARRDERDIRKTFILGVIISIGNLLSVFMVTNLSLNSSLSYMTVGVMASFLILDSIPRKTLRNAMYLGLLMLFTFHRFWVVMGFPNENGQNLLAVENYVRVGPNRGIFTSLSQCNANRLDYEEWKSNINAGDSVLAVSGWYIDSSVYLLTDAVISHYSTMCNPTYNDKLEKYWEQYPEKIPSVIAIRGYGGDISYLTGSWIKDYTDKYYRKETIGEYWTFYRKISDSSLVE